MGVEGGVVSLTNAGRTRDSGSGLCINRSDIPASCIDKDITSQISRSDLVSRLASQIASTGRRSPPRIRVPFGKEICTSIQITCNG